MLQVWLRLDGRSDDFFLSRKFAFLAFTRFSFHFHNTYLCTRHLNKLKILRQIHIRFILFTIHEEANQIKTCVFIINLMKLILAIKTGCDEA